jgi:amino acid adenylation domain-containing protein
MASSENVDTPVAAAESARDQLARRLRQKAAASQKVCPLSPGQNALLFLHRLAPQSPAYNVAFVARIVSAVDASALEKALQRLVDRHSALRTIYPEGNGGQAQVVCGSVELRLLQIDASAWTDEQLTREVHEAFSRPYDLEKGPVFRAILFSKASDNHVLLFGIHHIATDGWSQGILLNELQELYAAYLGGRTPCLPDLGISYEESVARRLAMLEGEKGRELWAFWEKTLGGELPVLDLPTDHPRPATLSMQGASCTFSIGEECYQQLRSFAKAEGVTFFTLTLAAFQVLLMRYTGKTDILVGTPMAARTERDFENVVGYFMNSVVLRGDLSGEITFRDFLHRFRDVMLGALSHQDFPFPLLVKRLCPERDANRSPIFQAMFNLQSARTLGPFADLLAGDETSAPVDFGGMRLKGFPLHQGAGAFDLIVELIDTGSRISGSLMYSLDLFKEETVARMAEHFQTLLAGIASTPDDLITKMAVITPRERQTISHSWNATRADYPSQTCVHTLVQSQAEKSPDAFAVTSWDGQFTYRQLIEKSMTIASRLQAAGVGTGHLVGVCIERSAAMIAAILGVLQAGSAYVPMDPAFPAERLALMLDDARCSAVLTQRSLAGSLPQSNATIICIDEDASPSASQQPFRPMKDQSSESLAYVIYTSGSTGRPKGVEISHRALVNFLASVQREPGISARDTLLSVTTISFDIFGLEIFLPLISGAREVIVKRDALADGRKLLHELQASKATIMQATPVTWRLLLESGWNKAAGLKVLCGGEALPRELADRILSTGAELWNMYGPTETTIWSSVCKVGEGIEPPRIGRPIANTQLYVLDGHLNLLPVGVPGELYIGGHGLAQGYHCDPKLTEQRFIPDIFGDESKGRLYKTGDLVKRLPDGSLEYIAGLQDRTGRDRDNPGADRWDRQGGGHGAGRCPGEQNPRRVLHLERKVDPRSGSAQVAAAETPFLHDTGHVRSSRCVPPDTEQKDRQEGLAATHRGHFPAG